MGTFDPNSKIHAVKVTKPHLPPKGGTKPAEGKNWTY